MAIFLEEKKNEKYQIFTPNGWVDFGGIGKTIEYEDWKICFEDGRELICADHHKFMVGEEVKICEDLEVGDYLESEEGLIKVTKIEKLSSKSNMYDLIDVEGCRYYTNGIISHNSTTVAAYALWYAIFNDDKFIGIVSNKISSAKEILHRMKEMYKSVLGWMKLGINEWNKNSIEFENGTRIQCAATSPSSMRGKSMNLLICDEFAFVPRNQCVLGKSSYIDIIWKGQNKRVTLEELWKMLEDENKCLKDMLIKRLNYS